MGEHLHDEYGIFLGDVLFYYLLYADDLALFSESPGGLQRQLDCLSSYCKKWHLIVNLPKTKIMLFNKRNCLNHFTFDGKPLEIVQSFKYLGVVLDSTKRHPLSCTPTHLAEQAKRAMFKSSQLCYSAMGKPSPAIALKMFDCQILPILEYGCEIWTCNKEFDVIEKVQLKQLKYMLGVRTQTSTLAIYADTGRFPLHLRQKFRMIKYWLHILKLHENNVVKSAYNTLLDLHNFGQNNWCTVVAEILRNADMYTHWENQCVLNDLVFLRNLKDKLFSQYVQVVNTKLAALSSDSKLRTYKLFKPEFCMESYIFSLPSITYMQAIAKFRLSSHNLRIETGRHMRPVTPVDQRKCLNCNTDNIEDERHFLLNCKKHENERRILFNVARKYLIGFDFLADDDKFVTLMSTKCHNVLLALGQYLHKCLNKPGPS